MAIAVFFQAKGLTAESYDEAMKQLDAAGAGSPKGRTYHCVFGPSDGLMVFDIWESQADFEAFGPTMMPIVTGLGIDPGQPDFMPVHNILQG